MANTNNSAAPFMNPFMSGLQILPAKPARQKKSSVPKAPDGAPASFLAAFSHDENKSTQQNSTRQMVKPKEGNAEGGMGDIISRAVRAKQEMEEKLGEAPGSNSEFSDVFCNPERQQEILGEKAPALGRIKVAAYIRVSTESSDQENSYETQERYFSRLLATNPSWVPVGIYSDYGISGTSKDKRTGFKRLLRHCAEGRIDRIVCKSISRFTRNTADFLTALQVLKDNNVTIYFEKEALDTANPMNDFVVTTLAAVAQQESYSISENIRLSIEKRHLNGEARNVEIYGYRFNGKTVTMDTGYQYRDLDIVEEEAAVVRRIYEEAADGKNYRQIAAGLNADHIPAPKQKSGKEKSDRKKKGALKDDIDQGWTGSRISHILYNERYAGDVKVQKTYTADCLTHKTRRNNGEMPQYVIHDHHPAIISRELYERTMDYLDAHRVSHTYSREDRALSGMLICAHCGRLFNVRNSSASRIWFCPSTSLNNGKHICHAERVYEKQVELMLRKAIAERFGKETDEVTETAVGNLKSTIEAYAATRKGFVAKMQARLEAVQNHDNTERDRAYLGKELTAIRLGNEGIEKRIALLATQKEAMLTRRNLLQDGSITDEMIAQKDAQMEAERARLAAGQAGEQKAAARFVELEDYWEALEDSYNEREDAIEWIENMEGQDKEPAFYDGLLDNLKAFVFSITVHSPTHFTIHWFDDSTSDVEMESNVDEGIHKK